MKEMVYVNTGEVKSANTETVLNSGAIGSCVVITAFDPIQNVGAMAHVMLPGSAPSKNQLHATKYAANAIEELLNQLHHFKVQKENMNICLIGGANVLKRNNDIIGQNNIAFVNSILKEKGIKIKAKSLGGFERRTAILDIEKGCVDFTVGDIKRKLLWKYQSSK